MKSKPTNQIVTFLLKSLIVILTLTVSYNVNASIKTAVLSGNSDTTKMISGVPLLPEDISPLLTGENIPKVNLLNAAGQSFDLNAAVASKPTILIFYRGGWCPFCSKQLAEYRK